MFAVSLLMLARLQSLYQEAVARNNMLADMLVRVSELESERDSQDFVLKSLHTMMDQQAEHGRHHGKEFSQLEEDLQLERKADAVTKAQLKQERSALFGVTTQVQQKREAREVAQSQLQQEREVREAA